MRATGVDDDRIAFVNIGQCRTRNQLLMRGVRLKSLKKRDVEPASMREHCAPIRWLEHPLLFQLSQIFANRYLAYFEQYSQLLDFDVPFVLEELHNSSSPRFRCHKPIRRGRPAYNAASCLYLRNFDRAVLAPAFFGSQRQTERFQGVLRPRGRLPSF